jgi:hypothetical protein
MPREAKTIRVEAGSELGCLLKEAARQPLIVELDGRRYLLDLENPLDREWTDEDTARARAAFAETAGSWADIDTEQMISDIYRWREEGSRSAHRP